MRCSERLQVWRLPCPLWLLWGVPSPGKSQCLARTATCLSCSKVGHFQKCCRSKPTTVSGAVVAAVKGLSRPPTLQVTVTCQRGTSPTSVAAVVDTSAMVCVAGPGLLHALKVPRCQLQPVSGLRDVADKPLKCMGAAMCTFSASGTSTTQPIYFLSSAKTLYLSYDACKGLGLLPPDFAHHTGVAAATSAIGGTVMAQQEQARPEGDCTPPRPDATPFAPLEENVGKLEEWLLRHFSETTFNAAKSPLPVMAGAPHHIVGFRVDRETYQPTTDRLSAIKEFTMPDQPAIKDIRSWYGLVNQLAPFLAAAPLMEPFGELLKKPTGKKVYWDDQLQLRFHQAQETICKLASNGFVYYDKSGTTAAVTDWSRDGIGFMVLQHCSCTSPETPFCCRGGWKLALCGSRHLTAAEASYAAVEGEALAVVWCLRKARLFLLGCPNLFIVTDHRPLVGLFKDRALGDITNPHLFRLKEKTLQFRFTIKYLPGKKNSAADLLSRFPSIKARPEEEDCKQEEELRVVVCAATLAALSPDGCIILDEGEVREAARDDPVYQSLLAKV